ncbi:monovalent cation/H(+) antiporter subunit G [Anoxynatronum buryatiense]|uniref:Multisubunit sodium/proton antiporter, MrpG subunit n=1 Tax=Anoxynatronum buryatiense TaxID=489973 RepID=A0AA46AI05_9CLOT|nr:monovalent cation/H(+) antiporter subunit G [Anoxynatronum buryatiense]SMP45027.1 multisubunit sodium/proton antiporter, MrpG subunit [Anoxynatronum buryatiense]
MIQNGLIVILLVGGIFFFLVGTMGLLRLPDAFTRMHATTKCDTLGAGLVLVALIVHQGFHMISLKLLVILVFIWITNPTAAHIIAKAAYHSQEKPSEVKVMGKE